MYKLDAMSILITIKWGYLSKLQLYCYGTSKLNIVTYMTIDNCDYKWKNGNCFWLIIVLTSRMEANIGEI